MKVLHVIPSVGPARGGPSFLLQTLVGGLAQSGAEVHVATTNDNGRARLDVRCSVPLAHAGATYWYFPRQTVFYTISWPLHQWLGRNIAAYDVVHVHALFSFSSLSAAYWAGKRRVPYIVRPLGTLNRWGMENRRPWLKKISFRFLESRILAGAAAVHYTSEPERVEADTLGIAHRAAVIPNAVESGPEVRDSGRFRALYPALQGRRMILFLSRFDAKKGLDLLLPAFAQVRRQEPDSMLVLAGAGHPDTVSRLRREAARLGLEPHVLWPGFLDGAAKRAALADADIFVLPSYSENFGIAVVEAMNASLPVVISDRVGIHRDVLAANAGLVVPCDVGSLAGALLDLLRDSQQRSTLARNAELLARRKYSLEAVTGQLLGLYREIVSPGELVRV